MPGQPPEVLYSAAPRDSQRSHPYAGCVAALATMHGKEQAIAPPFSGRLEVEMSVPPALDTDRLGTFTGEVPRPGSIDETAVAKARLGMDITGLQLGAASEGSYGPHPQMPFAPAGFECMVLVDDRREIVIREHLLDTAPVYASVETASVDAIGKYLDKIRFPSHAVIVQPNSPGEAGPAFHKGLRDGAALSAAIQASRRLSEDGLALVSTDMRAHLNPTRMRTLSRLAHNLVERIATLCPACGAPGHGKVDVEKGLPCAWCDRPTERVAREVFGCVDCEHRDVRPRSDGMDRADPGHCAHCNP